MNVAAASALKGRPGLTATAFRGGAAAALAPLALAATAWLLSLGSIDTGSLGKYGLPPALPLAWYAALAVLVAGATAACWVARPRAWVIACYLAAVVVVLYATVPAITDVPHYNWVYKHIGVVRFIAEHHGVDASVDIYNRWPGFFALAAAFSNWTGLDPIAYAAWAEPFFAMLETFLVAAIAFAVSRNLGVAGFAGLLFAVGNWIGQAYFAPQAAAYSLALALLLVVLRQFAGGSLSPRLTAIVARISRRDQQTVVLAAPLPWSRRASVALVLGLDAALVATHQLTPYVLLLQVGALAVLGVVRPRWLVAAMAAITALYLVPNFDYVTQNYGLFSGFNLAHNSQSAEGKIAGVSWVFARAGAVLWATLLVLMVVSAVRLARRGSGAQALTLLVLACAPYGLLLGNDYGGEASLRVFLFSSPWADVLIALAIGTLASRRVRMVAAIVAAFAIAIPFIPAFYGAEELRIMPPGEVQASEYFYAHARAGSVLLLAAPDFPGRVGARYSLMEAAQVDDWPTVSAAVFEGAPLGSAQVSDVVRVIHDYAPRGYVVFSTTGTRYAELHQLAPPGALPGLERAIQASKRFRLWYAGPDARIYELVR